MITHYMPCGLNLHGPFPGAGEVRVKIEGSKMRMTFGAPHSIYMTIQHAAEYHVVDTGDLQRYDFFEVTGWDAANRVLTIWISVPTWNEVFTSWREWLRSYGIVNWWQRRPRWRDKSNGSPA